MTWLVRTHVAENQALLCLSMCKLLDQVLAALLACLDLIRCFVMGFEAGFELVVVFNRCVSNRLVGCLVDHRRLRQVPCNRGWDLLLMDSAR